MFDALNGVSAAGIKVPIIKDSMVADDASISGYKVNVQTLVQNINGSDVQIQGSKVVIDGTGQTISAKFDTMQEEIDGIATSGGGYTLQTYVDGGHTGDGETATIHSGRIISYGPDYQKMIRVIENGMAVRPRGIRYPSQVMT